MFFVISILLLLIYFRCYSMLKIKWKLNKTAWFTLVELIVVVTILAILATIGFVSYSSYLTWVRDTNRLAQLVSISDWLELYSTKNNLPLPDDNIEILASTVTIAYQGYAWANTLETIDFTKWWKDPRDDQYFTYYLTKDRKYFQLMWFLEESLDATSQLSSPSWKGMPIGQGKLSFIEKSHAWDYDDRIPTVYGKKLWILTDTDNTPIQDITTIQTDWLLAIDVTTDSYIARLTDKISITWDNSELSVLVSALTPASSNPTSCKEALSPKTYLKDGIYKVKLNGTKTDVYCDMTTEWWGWTLVWNFNAWWLPYNSAQIGKSENFFTGSWKLSDNDINSINATQFSYEWVESVKYKYSEFLYCDSINFDYSWIWLASWASLCSRVFSTNNNGYVSSGAYTITWYVISHWSQRDVWLRGSDNTLTRWQHNDWNPGNYINTASGISRWGVDIRLWVK